MDGIREEKNIMEYETVALDDENSALVILDQTKLPGKAELISPERRSGTLSIC